MKFTWLKQLRDAFLSIIPVLAVVLVTYFTRLINVTGDDMIMFTVACVFVVFGMWLFARGSETSMTKMGEYVGSSLTKKQSLIILIIIFFLVGVFITVAEPDISVFASQISDSNLSKILLILAIGIGVGIFLVIGVLRIIFQKSLKVWLLAFYGLLFALACIADARLLPISFDSGGTTTGPISTPFILALGIGLAVSRGGSKSNSDSFGLVAFCSIGPILMVMILSFIIPMDSNLSNFAGTPLLESLGTYAWQVVVALSPIVIFFIIYELIAIKLPKKTVGKIVIGILYTYVGLVLFLTGVESGFKTIAHHVGNDLAQDSNKLWILFVIGFLLGFGSIFVEPAIHVLTDQIETISDGVVSRWKVLIALAIGNGIAILLSLFRVIFDIPFLYIVVPGYIIVFILSFVVPDIYTAIAFDSGGAASGPMNTTFILPISIGACYAIAPEKITSNAFGTIAMVAMMPMIAIQLVGLIAQIKVSMSYKIARNRVRAIDDNQIIHFEEN